MPVFISYHRPDQWKAEQVRQRLSLQGIQTYLDVMDANLDPNMVTVAIARGLTACTHLLALISGTTVASWWVPWEIGFATRGERRITSYQMSQVVLPEYLRMWPVLTSDADLDLFALYYKQDRVVLQESKRFDEAERATIRTPDQFHRELKASLSSPRYRW